ncbi:MAG: bifunctional enoyl-CoA hydratase/phosphate acetyltransferase [Pseudomonadota bacterium]
MVRLTSHTLADLQVGMTAELTRLCVTDDLYVFANASGNLNPMHLPKLDGDGDGVAEAVAPSMWLAALISAVLGNQLPGPGTLLRAQALTFHQRVHAGETVTAKVEVTHIQPDGSVTLGTSVTRADGIRVVEGTADVIAPPRAHSVEIGDVPGLTLQQHVHFDQLLARAAPLPALRCAVVAPEEEAALDGALIAADETLIDPILVGDAAEIAQTAKALGRDIAAFEVVHAPDHEAAAARAVELVHEGRAQAVMKGHLHTDTLLRHVVKRAGGLRTGRRLSHVFVMDVPGLDHMLAITDAAINIAPDLTAKQDITQNAIDLMRALGVDTPRVGVLSAVETVNPAIPSTLDAAALSKMADRGQITGGLVDGPLAMDNAIDISAARRKGIKSLVAGKADVLVAPNLEAGNMIAKELTFLAHAEAAGVVIGAQVPIILTSRADTKAARRASCAVAALYAAHRA